MRRCIRELAILLLNEAPVLLKQSSDVNLLDIRIGDHQLVP